MFQHSTSPLVIQDPVYTRPTHSTITITVDNQQLSTILSGNTSMIPPSNITWTADPVSGMVYYDSLESTKKTIPFNEELLFPYLQDLIDICSDEELHTLCKHMTELLLFWAKRKGIIHKNP